MLAPNPKSKIKNLKLTAIVVASVGSACFAQLAIDWSTIDAGGAMNSAGGSFGLSGTIGQPAAQSPPIMSGGAFELTGGFWPVTLVCYCPGDMTGDGKRDGRDVQEFVACLIAGGNCSCADIDAANGVTLADVNSFVTNLLATMPCP